MQMFCKRRFEDRRGASVLAVIIGLFLTCGAAKALANEELREWSDTTGRHKLTARLQAFSEGAVTLEMADGKLMEINIDKLGTKDRPYVLAHYGDLKKADDNPFKEKNAAELERLEAKLKATQRQVEENAQAASDNAAKLDGLETKLGDLKRELGDTERKLDDMAGQLFFVKLRAAAARTDALLLDQQFSKVEVTCLEDQVRGAEATFKVVNARLEAGSVSELDRQRAKAALFMLKGCVAWVKGDLPQCQKEYDGAVAACKECAEIVRTQQQVGTVDYPTLLLAEAATKEAELCASRVKGRIAARESRRSK